MTFNLPAAKKRCEEATPGPWVDTSTLDEVRPIASVAGDSYCEICYDPEMDDRENDRAFIAHARTDLPAAIARIEWQEKRLDEAREMLLCAKVHGDWDKFTEGVETWLHAVEKGPPDDVAG